jgi:hypothetical protein
MPMGIFRHFVPETLPEAFSQGERVVVRGGPRLEREKIIVPPNGVGALAGDDSEVVEIP